LGPAARSPPPLSFAYDDYPHCSNRAAVEQRKFAATDLLLAGYDIRTVQELLGHHNVKTPMIYTDVLNRGGRGVAHEEFTSGKNS
jgi:integrase